jgi:ribosome biogenesis GTPase
LNLHKLGWNEFFQSGFEDFKNIELFPARVISQQKSEYVVSYENGEISAKIAGKFYYKNKMRKNYPVVGDWVVINLIDNGERAIIKDVIERKNYFSRKAPISGGRKIKNDMIEGGITEEQVIAANIDTIFIICGLDNNFNIRRIERYLTLVYNSGISPVIILNKSDICEEIEEYIQKVKKISFDIPVYHISVIKNQGLENLEKYLGFGKTVAFIGSSGVGKSTLTNYLLNENRQKIKSVNESHGKGRHTTTHREMIILPSGAMVIDNPGMREIQLWGGIEEVEKNFEDIIEISKRCKFRNCQHTTEPGCAVKEALENGTIDKERYNNFLRQFKEMERLEEKKKIFDKKLTSKEKLRLKMKNNK